MSIAANILIALIALFHCWILTMEMFLWTHPIGMKTFRNTPQRAKDTAVLAANQGLYNGFLVAGLIWSLIAVDPSQAYSLKLFFLGCVAIAGIYGGITAIPRIFLVQGLPALIALALVVFGG